MNFLDKFWNDTFHSSQKVRSIMKFSTVAFLSCSINASAAMNSTKVKLSLDIDNQSIKEVLFLIENQSDFRFIYETGKIDLDRKVSLHAKEQGVDKILNQLFQSEGIHYELTENNLILINPGVNNKRDHPANSQQEKVRTIKGVVKEDNGEPVIGANVSVLGTTIGSITNLDGEFELTIPEDAILLVSYIGFIQKEIPTKGQSFFNIILSEDSQALDEVVVVGFGTQKKLNLTGAISSVKGEEMSIRPVANTAAMLQGQVPGLYVTQSTGQPGEENVSFRIRGNGSYGSSTSPLVLINGIEGDISGLDPNIIESVNVLKDAASAAIYGARAANGVILVTTKQGTRDRKPVVSYTGNFSFQKATKMYELVTNSADYMTLANLAKDNSGLGNKYPEEEIEKYRQNGGTEQYPNFDWLGYMFNTAFQQTHNLSLMGATEKTTYNLSLNYLDQDGTLRGHHYRRYNVTLDMSAYATDWIRIGAYATMKHGDRQKTRQSQDDALLSTMSQAPTYMPWLPDDGTGVKKWTNSAYGYESHNKNMPAIIGEGIFAPRKDYDLNTQIWAEVKFLKNLSWNTKGAIRYYSRRDEDWRGKDVPLYMYHTGETSGTLDKGGLGLSVSDLRQLNTTLQTYVSYDYSSQNGSNKIGRAHV